MKGHVTTIAAYDNTGKAGSVIGAVDTTAASVWLRAVPADAHALDRFGLSALIAGAGALAIIATMILLYSIKG